MEKLSGDRGKNFYNLQKKKEKILEEYPPSFKSFLDDLTKNIYEEKGKEQGKSLEKYLALLRSTKRLLLSLENYWKSYKSCEEAAKEAREERQLKGSSLEPQEIQSLNQNLQLRDLARRNAHLELTRDYYTFITSYKEYFGHRFPWLSSDICDEEGNIKSEFLEHSSNDSDQINASKIFSWEKENIRKWAAKMMREKESDEAKPERQQELKPYLDLIDYEWKRNQQLSRRKDGKEKIS